jgi:hypothetical protein
MNIYKITWNVICWHSLHNQWIVYGWTITDKGVSYQYGESEMETKIHFLQRKSNEISGQTLDIISIENLGPSMFEL